MPKGNNKKMSKGTSNIVKRALALKKSKQKKASELTSIDHPRMIEGNVKTTAPGNKRAGGIKLHKQPKQLLPKQKRKKMEKLALIYNLKRNPLGSKGTFKQRDLTDEIAKITRQYNTLGRGSILPGLTGKPDNPKRK